MIVTSYKLNLTNYNHRNNRYNFARVQHMLNERLTSSQMVM